MQKKVSALMATYFKDKKFRLFYLDVEGGIPVSMIPRSITDDADKSLVIAARGSEMSSDVLFAPEFKIEVIYSVDQEPKKILFREVYDHIYSLREEDRKSFFDINSRCADQIIQMMEYMKDCTVNRLLVLAENDEQPIKKPTNPELLCFEVKEGGPELVIEFLLSAFCRHVDYEWVRRDDPSQKYSPPDDYFLAYISFTDEVKAKYKEIPIYNFSINSNFDDLIEYELDGYDDGGGPGCKGSSDFYYYSVNLQALTKLKEMIYIPGRVQNILTSEQIAKLDAEVQGILMNELDYIARVVLKQKVDSCVNDLANEYRRMSERQWTSDMYDTLGGDGEGNVYMNDGLSLSPDGRTVDD